MVFQAVKTSEHQLLTPTKSWHLISTVSCQLVIRYTACMPFFQAYAQPAMLRTATCSTTAQAAFHRTCQHRVISLEKPGKRLLPGCQQAEQTTVLQIITCAVRSLLLINAQPYPQSITPHKQPRDDAALWSSVRDSSTHAFSFSSYRDALQHEQAAMPDANHQFVWLGLGRQCMHDP